MLKIIMLGFVLVAIALSGAVHVASFEPILSPLQPAHGSIQANETDASPIEAMADDYVGYPPSLTLSRLPNLNETAIVEINFTNPYPFDVLDPNLHSIMVTGWDLGPGLEIVDAGDLQYEVLDPDHRYYPSYTSYIAFTPLHVGESISYSLEVRAVSEGPVRIGAVGYSGGWIEMHLYIDDEETMLLVDHAEKYPELYLPPSQRQESDTTRYLTESELKDIPTTISQPTREELMETFTLYLKNSGDTVEWAVESLLQSGIMNSTELRTVLRDVGFTEDEISEGMQSAASAETVPSPLQQVRDGVPTDEVVCSEDRVLMMSQSGMPACVFKESVLWLEFRGFEFIGEPFDMFPIKSFDLQQSHVSTFQVGPRPVVSMSNLPNIGETAVVEITYTSKLPYNVTDSDDLPTHNIYQLGWMVTSGFEIVDSGGVEPWTIYAGKDEPSALTYQEFVPLDSGETKTYRIVVKAINEDVSYVLGVGYYSETASIILYLDDEETLPLLEHIKKYPEMYQRSVRAEPQPDLPPTKAERDALMAATPPYVPPTREKVLEWFADFFGDKNPNPEVGWALDLVLNLGKSVNINITDARQILSDIGYSDGEIDDAVSGTVSVASAKTVPSPLQQVRDGVPTGEVVCSDDRVLMLSPSGSPACVFEASGDMLKQRGFVKVSGADSEESLTNDAEQRPLLHRGPYNPSIIDTTGRPNGSFDVITESLDELRLAKHTPRQSSSDGFVVADWIPDYVPKGYRLVHTLHQTWPDYNNGTNHHLNLYFAPDSFNFTSSTTYPDLWNAGGLFYAVQPNNSDKYDSYENIRESPGPLVNPVDIINQTNGYFGLQNPDNGYFGLQNPDNGYASFSVVAAFETQKIHIVTRADIPHAEGTKMINSIQGVLFPE